MKRFPCRHSRCFVFVVVEGLDQERRQHRSHQSHHRRFRFVVGVLVLFPTTVLGVFVPAHLVSVRLPPLFLPFLLLNRTLRGSRQMGHLLPRFSPPEVFTLELLKVQLESQ